MKKRTKREKERKNGNKKGEQKTQKKKRGSYITFRGDDSLRRYSKWKKPLIKEMELV